MAVSKKNPIQGFACERKVFPKLAKIKLSHILGFGDVSPCGRGVGHARGLPGSRTRAACLTSALGQMSGIHRFRSILTFC